METVKSEDFLSLLLQLEKDFGWDMILYDFYGVYRAIPKLEKLFEIEYKWHTNPFCMRVKSDYRLFNRCVKLKDVYLLPEIQKGVPFWGTCYCGVTEYILPICVSGVIIAALNITGFYNSLSQNRIRLISKRLGLKCDDLEDFHCQSLKRLDNREKHRVEIYSRIIATELERLAEQSMLREEFQAAGQLSGSSRLYLDAVDYIRKNFAEDITPLSVAQKFNVSLSLLQHVFSKKSGNGVASAIRDCRLGRSAELLYTTQMPVKSVAINVGYINVDYFSVMFKKKFGVTPLEYRRQKREDFS